MDITMAKNIVVIGKLDDRIKYFETLQESIRNKNQGNNADYCKAISKRMYELHMKNETVNMLSFSKITEITEDDLNKDAIIFLMSDDNIYNQKMVAMLGRDSIFERTHYYQDGVDEPLQIVNETLNSCAYKFRSTDKMLSSLPTNSLAAMQKAATSIAVKNAILIQENVVDYAYSQLLLFYRAHTKQHASEYDTFNACELTTFSHN